MKEKGLFQFGYIFNLLLFLSYVSLSIFYDLQNEKSSFMYPFAICLALLFCQSFYLSTWPAIVYTWFIRLG